MEAPDAALLMREFVLSPQGGPPAPSPALEEMMQDEQLLNGFKGYLQETDQASAALMTRVHDKLLAADGGVEGSKRRRPKQAETQRKYRERQKQRMSDLQEENAALKARVADLERQLQAAQGGAAASNGAGAASNGKGAGPAPSGETHSGAGPRPAGSTGSGGSGGPSPAPQKRATSALEAISRDGSQLSPDELKASFDATKARSMDLLAMGASDTDLVESLDTSLALCLVGKGTGNEMFVAGRAGGEQQGACGKLDGAIAAALRAKELPVETRVALIAWRDSFYDAIERLHQKRMHRLGLLQTLSALEGSSLVGQVAAGENSALGSGDPVQLQGQQAFLLDEVKENLEEQMRVNWHYHRALYTTVLPARVFAAIFCDPTYPILCEILAVVNYLAKTEAELRQLQLPALPVAQPPLADTEALREVYPNNGANNGAAY